VVFTSHDKIESTATGFPGICYPQPTIFRFCFNILKFDMKRKAIVAARNKKAKKKARADDINVQEESAIIPRVSDLGSFETIPIEMQRYIIADIFLASPLTKDNYRIIIRIKSTCVRFKQILDVACGEDFYWGELYLKIFGDLSKNKTKKCKSAKDKFLAVYSTILEIWPQDASATERDNGMLTVIKLKDCYLF
jgi:hypothetical protein